MFHTLRQHYPEYLMEAAGLGIFMVMAAACTMLVEHPASPLHASMTDPALRRSLIGVAMGLTAVGLIYSRWGQRSGAHLNPAVTLSFFRLGKIAAPDAAAYVVAQFLGGAAGILAVGLVAGTLLADPSVNYVATRPGSAGPWVAFAAEAAISFLLMAVVLIVSNTDRLARFTGLFAGLLVAAYISIEAPLSGMSMNPARSLASALPGHLWTSLWIYFTAPPIGMLLAAEGYVRLTGSGRVRCAKLHYQNAGRCIFICGYAAQQHTPSAVAVPRAADPGRTGSPRASKRGGMPVAKEA